MDACFQIILPEIKPLNGLLYKQASITWGGIEYPQYPGSYHWGNSVELVEGEISDYIHRYVPCEYLDDNWTELHLKREALDMLEDEVNGAEVDWGGKSLEGFLRAMLAQYDRWVVVFDLYCDQVDNVYELGIDEFIDKLKANLTLDAAREGFVVLSPRDS